MKVFDIKKEEASPIPQAKQKQTNDNFKNFKEKKIDDWKF